MLYEWYEKKRSLPTDIPTHDHRGQLFSAYGMQLSKDEPVMSQADDDFACRRASVQRKVDEIKANLEKKRLARKRYEEHIKSSPPTIASTDYIKWDIWCPIDDEDELVAACTPNNSQLRAMEKDINDRHARCGFFGVFQYHV